MVVMRNGATITSKKMVTVPARIMKKYGLVQGQKVRFVEGDGSILLVPVANLSGLFGLGREHSEELVDAVRELDEEHSKEGRSDGPQADA
jgi:bifunctional DNA-binding transcriptional regulator/antitoxin component of YhaV-PrlF toxin-antitoxin module